MDTRLSNVEIFVSYVPVPFRERATYVWSFCGHSVRRVDLGPGQTYFGTDDFPEMQARLVLAEQLEDEPLGDFLLPRAQPRVSPLAQCRVGHVGKVHTQQALPRIALPKTGNYISAGSKLSFFSYSTLNGGIWQFWWNTFGHLSQHTSSPPSIQTAHQSSLGSSLSVSFAALFFVPSSVELSTWGEPPVFARPSARTCTPLLSNLAIVAIRSLTDSWQYLSRLSVSSPANSTNAFLRHSRIFLRLIVSTKIKARVNANNF